VHGPRICLCIAEEDLRSWVLDELMLMTWPTQPIYTTIIDLEDIAAMAPNVVLVGVDRIPPHVVEQLRARTWTTPVIAIGAGSVGFPAEHILGTWLTSRELKQALRATLLEATRPHPEHPANAMR
jgi:hypothetical protein